MSDNGLHDLHYPTCRDLQAIRESIAHALNALPSTTSLDPRTMTVLAAQIDSGMTEDLAARSDGQLGTLWRMCAALQRVIQELWWRRDGYTVRRWSGGGPSPYRDMLYGAWIDHPSRLVKADCATIYVSQPYDLSIEAMKELIALSEQGWHVWVHGRSTHFPNWTVVVEVWKGERRGPASTAPDVD